MSNGRQDIRIIVEDGESARDPWTTADYGEQRLVARISVYAVRRPSGAYSSTQLVRGNTATQHYFVSDASEFGWGRDNSLPGRTSEERTVSSTPETTATYTQGTNNRGERDDGNRQRVSEGYDFLNDDTDSDETPSRGAMRDIDPNRPYAPATTGGAVRPRYQCPCDICTLVRSNNVSSSNPGGHVSGGGPGVQRRHHAGGMGGYPWPDLGRTGSGWRAYADGLPDSGRAGASPARNRHQVGTRTREPEEEGMVHDEVVLSHGSHGQANEDSVLLCSKQGQCEGTV